MRVVVVDYGSGNLQSVLQSIKTAAHNAELDCTISLTNRTDEVAGADRIVLPGVGSFADCAQNLRSIDGMEMALNDAVLKRARPFLGICVGMQLMADRGLEFGDVPGLGWIAGTVQKIETPQKQQQLKIPHMGWNALKLKKKHPVFTKIQKAHATYFTHSYQFTPKLNDDIIAEIIYGSPIVAAIGKKNFIGMQFHPEKSQKVGQIILTNWLKWKP